MSRLPLLTAAEFRDIMLRGLARHQALGFLEQDGAEAVDAFAILYARLLEQAADKLGGALYFTARGPGYTRGTLRLTFTVGTVHAGEVLAGQHVAATRWGVAYVLDETLTIPAGLAADAVIDVRIRALWRGFEANTDPAFLTRFTIADGVEPAEAIRWGLTTSAAAKAEIVGGFLDGSTAWEVLELDRGGNDGTLELLADGRGAYRQGGESDASLTKRARGLFDAVDPSTILAAVQSLLDLHWRTWGGTRVTAVLSEWWEWGFVAGHVARGAVNLYPVAGHNTFAILIPDPGEWGGGFYVSTIAGGPSGAVNRTPIGYRDVVRGGLVAAIVALVDELRAAGFRGRVVVGRGVGA